MKNTKVTPEEMAGEPLKPPVKSVAVQKSRKKRVSPNAKPKNFTIRQFLNGNHAGTDSFVIAEIETNWVTHHSYRFKLHSCEEKAVIHGDICTKEDIKRELRKLLNIKYPLEMLIEELNAALSRLVQEEEKLKNEK